MKRLLALLLCVVTVFTCLPVMAKAQTPLEILQQPQGCRVSIGETFSATVVASGDDLRYQWYYCDSGSKFKKSSNTTDTYSYPMTAKRDGRKAYCIVSDRYGNSLKTDTVVFQIPRPKITVQPESVSVYLGQDATVTVEATGNGLRYQWYYCDSGSKFKKSSNTTDTYSYPMTAKRDGRKVYCVVKDANGYSVKSDIAVLRILKPQITKQPETVYVLADQEATVTVEATGEGLRYQWYYCNSGKSKYLKSENTTDTYTAVMDSGSKNRKVYCVVTDQYGYSVKSKTATLKLMTPARITKQPVDTRVVFSKTAKTTVSAKGDGIKYQWYYRNARDTEFQKSSQTGSSYSTTMTAARSGRYVYCVVTDKYGNSLQSNTVRLLAAGKFKSGEYLLPLEKEKALRNQLSFTVNEALQWETSDPEIAAISEDGVVTGISKGTATITVTGTVTGVRASCKIHVGRSPQVALTFDDGPSTHTARLLNYLETTDAKVTFFMVGNRINSYKTSVRRMAEQGHELGYHSYAHADQTGLSSSQITADYNRSNKILKNITGRGFTVWRTPGGSFNSRVLKAVPLPHIFWTSSTEDWRTRNETAVYNAILKQAKDGAIILLHDLHGTTVDGAIRAMKKLEAEGFEFVTVTELLSRNGTPPKPGVNYVRG